MTSLAVLAPPPVVASANTGASSHREAPTRLTGSRIATGPHTAAGIALALTPSSALVDGQAVSFSVTGAVPGGTYVVVECGPQALTLLEGGCNSRANDVVFIDAGGNATGTLAAAATFVTDAGSVDCRSASCFVAAFGLYLPGEPNSISFAIQDFSFSADACAAAGSCALPVDAFAPGLPGYTDGPHPAAVSQPTTLTLQAGVAGDLTASGAISGPYTTGELSGGTAPPATPVTGEGLLRLAMEAPGTGYGATDPTSVVVDVSVDGGPSQQIVLFWGAQPFVYAAFTGPLTTGAHQVTVTVDAALSETGSAPPTATVVAAELEVVDPTNPMYLAYAYAPEMYGRSTSALQDTPLLVDATATAGSGGSTQLSYTYIWAHEDSGTGFVPFLESGEWGRMTDIENAISFTVAADGSVSDATYLWGGESATGYPDSEDALSETTVPFGGQWNGHHPILRDATGNNDFSDAGTTPFLFQLAPLPGPAAGQAREAVMDANPWTYEVMGEDVGRWYSDINADPDSPEPGDARQYAYVDLDTTGTGVSSIGVDLELSGGGASSPAWYDNDFGSGYPLVGAGHVRTVVKLPTGWLSDQVVGVRLQVFPPSAAASVKVASLSIEGLDQDWNLSTLTPPTPTIVPGYVDIPCAGTGTSTPTLIAAGGDGSAYTCAGESLLGTMAGTPLAAPVTGIAATPDGNGYWLVGADGGVLTEGDASFYGSAASTPSSSPFVGIAATPDGQGYWLVDAAGQVVPFGDAVQYGGLQGQQFGGTVTGIATTPDGNGYWLATSGGGVFAFGDAPFEGSMAGTPLDAPVTGIAATPGGNGYWLVGADGGVFSFGDAGYSGSMAGTPLDAPVTGIAATPGGNGYWLVGADGGVFSFGDATFEGSLAGTPLPAPVVGAAVLTPG